MEEVVDTVMSMLTGMFVGLWLVYRWGKDNNDDD